MSTMEAVVGIPSSPSPARSATCSPSPRASPGGGGRGPPVPTPPKKTNLQHARGKKIIKRSNETWGKKEYAKKIRPKQKPYSVAFLVSSEGRPWVKGMMGAPGEGAEGGL